MLGIPGDDTSSGAEASSYKELVAEIAHLRELLERNVGEPAKLNERLGQRDTRITELERLLSESRRSGKRQAAPFSKGDPKRGAGEAGKAERRCPWSPRPPHGSCERPRPGGRRVAAVVVPGLWR